MIKMTKKGETARFKNHTRKIKLPFLIYADFESVLISGKNEKQNTDESCTNKYQNHIGCSFTYKLVYVEDQFSKPFQPYLGMFISMFIIRLFISLSLNIAFT